MSGLVEPYHADGHGIDADGVSAAWSEGPSEVVVVSMTNDRYGRTLEVRPLGLFACVNLIRVDWPARMVAPRGRGARLMVAPPAPTGNRFPVAAADGNDVELTVGQQPPPVPEAGGAA
ncbi:hypothetical protein [Leifsonia sp. LS1]|uniref:hypothetical protein n=1 Tax=Leifsonia sp. LS1 TaxID=2828483 RepID=UPI001CFCBD3D|nr:hypothetical protein [Leifsonia sp. LS1]